MKSAAGVSFIHVPYRGAGPQITDLLGGQTDFAVTSVPSSAPFLKSGKLRALAVTSEKRSPAWPDVPTVAEAGVPGYAADVWYGVFAPAGTSPEIVAKLNAVLKRAARSDAFIKRIESEGVEISVSTPEALGRLASDEAARWKAFVTEHGIKNE